MSLPCHNILQKGRKKVTNLLRLENISVHFGGHVAVNNVSLDVNQESITGLIGPNGAGKTTLFNVISGLIAPNSGDIIYDEQKISSLSPHKRARIGIGRTFQRLELFNSLSVVENIQVSAEIRNQWNQARLQLSPTAIKSEVERILELTGLTSSKDRMVSEIPTGQARLVELGRALILSPKLLLLDEPASGQNEEETENFGLLLRRLSESGIAIFLVEHDMNLVMNICDKVNVLDFGSIIAHGTPKEIQQHELVLQAYLGANNQ